MSKQLARQQYQRSSFQRGRHPLNLKVCIALFHTQRKIGNVADLAGIDSAAVYLNGLREQTL